MLAEVFTARFWSWRRISALAIQGLALAALGALAWGAVGNAIANLARLKINTGFDFLARPAGFAIGQHLIAYSEASSYSAAFLVALLNTVVLALIAIAIATPLGFLVGIARRAANPLAAGAARGYVETLRNVPLLLQLFFWYFAVLQALPPPRQSLSLLGSVFLSNRGLVLPVPTAGDGTWAALGVLVAGALAAGAACALRRQTRAARAGWIATLTLGLALPVAALAAAALVANWQRPVLSGFNFAGGLTVIPEFVAMTLGLSLYSAAYIAEIVRAGLASVPHGQVEAARALGLKTAPLYARIVVPQALRAIVPPLGNEYLRLTRNTTLAAAIAYPDLMLVFAGTVLTQTSQVFEVMAMTAATYLAIALAMAGGINLYNRRVLRVGGR
jgi:general L-amino acid transport system permease protein